ncbi:MAG: sigma-54-dependent Fis family transcriptional regulator [Magnetococcales bacterium]|nr:sigma-54-dependent Fis family transcriptional regulator [Magnetococcales bacterium]MBF0156943.1 sigma-54-dependent Fis family transcriptional regulator [Magnetococcales bacterium]
MQKSVEIYQRLLTLKAHLDRVNRAWTPHDYEQLMTYFVEILPTLMRAERCSIFVVGPDSGEIWLKFGTGLEEKQLEAPREGSVVGESISTGSVVIRNDLDREEGFHLVADRKTAFITRNIVCVPIRSLFESRYIGAVEVLNTLDRPGFETSDGVYLQRVVRYLALALENNLVSEGIIQVSKMMYDDLSSSEKEIFGEHRFVAVSPAMRRVVEMAQRVGVLPINVFITGESGTGKEVIARMIHRVEDRRTRPFVAVNCSSIPDHLMESEFFGYEKGAFTGATGSRMGRFEEATGGTLFLDEIADMPASIQPKFLRAIQENEGTRLGSNKVYSYRFRIVSASSRDLATEVREGRFREDLFFRLFSVDILIPPLRERREDIVPLALMFLNEINKRFKKRVAGFSPRALALFEAYSWPGNVRELQHEVERLVALTADGENISEESCSRKLARIRNQEEEALPDGPLSIPAQRERLEIRLIRAAMEKTGGNKIRAAKLLEITRQSLHTKLKQYGERLAVADP